MIQEKVTQEKAALIIDPSRQPFHVGLLAAQAGYSVDIRRSFREAMEEVDALGCEYDLVIIIDTVSDAGIQLLECIRYGGFEGLIVFYGRPDSRGAARAIGGQGFEFAPSIDALAALVRASRLVSD